MELNLCPYIRRAWYNILMPGEIIGKRVIFDYELLLVKEGHAEIRIEDHSFRAQPGDLFIFRPKQQHAIYVDPGEQLIQPHIHFDLTYYEDRRDVPVSYNDIDKILPQQMSFFRPDILNEFVSPFPSCLHPHNRTYIEQLLFDIIHAVDNPRSFNDVYLQHTFLRLWEQVLLEVTYMNRQFTKQGSTAVVIRQYIEQNDSRPLSLDEMSQALHFSKSYIARVFNGSYQTSPIKYHTILQIQKAKRMIIFTNMSLSEISSSVGFDSLQDFSRVFKKIDGCAPSSYRKNNSLSPAQNTTGK